MNFKSLIQLLDHFKDEETCIKHYEYIRWKGNPTCPHCGSISPYVTNRGYKCSSKLCKKKFTVKVGTIFENTKLPMRTWFAAIYLCTTSKKGISSVQLASQLDITQKSAWFVLHRIREMLREKAPQMIGENKSVEVDESYIGGKEKNKHKVKKRSAENPDLTNEGKPYKPKNTVIGLIERNGKIIVRHIANAQGETLGEVIDNHVPKGSTIYTDEHRGYSQLNRFYYHGTVNHSAHVYVDGDIHTNTIENFWSILKRGIYGIYHQVSDKHLHRYLDEFSGRFNTRSYRNDLRFHSFLAQSNTRLSYNMLIGKV